MTQMINKIGHRSRRCVPRSLDECITCMMVDAVDAIELDILRCQAHNLAHANRHNVLNERRSIRKRKAFPLATTAKNSIRANS